MHSLIKGIDHIGIRVANLERSRAFYAQLGFELVMGPEGPEPVAILKHSSGAEINLIINAQPKEPAHNVLMDEPVKLAGYTHMALRCEDVAAAQAALAKAGISLSGGPVTFTNGHTSIFVRDPDRNVIELTQSPPRTGAR